MQTIKLILTLQKSTKNKHVYGAEGAAVESLYIDRSALPTLPPQSITVTIE